MNIALVIERMDPSAGGREVSTGQIAAHLARRGHGVTVVCREGALDREGVTIRALGRRGILRPARVRNFIADASAAVADGGFDVVHATLPVPGADVYQARSGTVPGQIAAGQKRRGLLGPLRTAVFGPWNRVRVLFARLERELVADPDVWCLPVSEMVAQEFRDHYGRENRLRVIYNAVDVPDVTPETRADWRQAIRYRLGVGKDDPVFLTVAKNLALKGVVETIRAFAKWRHGHLGRSGRLVVVGRENPEGYQRIAGLRDVGRLVTFVPPTDEIFRWYAAADACVLLSWYDPCSRVVLEATRWGIPSITTVSNGAAEALAEGGGIVVAGPREIAAVAEAMEQLADPQERARRGAACLRVADGLSVERHVTELLDVYEQVRAAKTGRPG